MAKSGWCIDGLHEGQEGGCDRPNCSCLCHPRNQEASSA